REPSGSSVVINPNTRSIATWRIKTQARGGQHKLAATVQSECSAVDGEVVQGRVTPVPVVQRPNVLGARSASHLKLMVGFHNGQSEGVSRLQQAGAAWSIKSYVQSIGP